VLQRIAPIITALWNVFEISTAPAVDTGA